MAYHKTKEELENDTSWHFIELKKLHIDSDRLSQWYGDVLKNLEHLRFNFSRDDLVISGTKQNMLQGGIHSFGISWPAEQELPIPPRYAARPDLYPEIGDDEQKFSDQMRVMQKYKFGYFKELYDQCGEEFFSWSRITVHDAGAEITPHIDGGVHLFRIHIPIVTNKDALFFWGDTEYNFEVGKAYLINTGITHRTINNGATERAHIITHPMNVSWILENLV